jgi:histidinol-phosphate phosphatase family protein
LMRSTDLTTAMILAGGVGSRLRSVVSDRPKVLASIHGRPFLAYLLDVLDRAGVREVVLCTGYMAEFVEETLGTRFGRMRLVYSRESTPLGTGGAIRAALGRVDAKSLLIFNGDSFCEADLASMAAVHCARRAKATILLTEVPDTARFGRVWIDDDGQLLTFEEKGAHAGPGWINAGVYFVQRELLESIPAGHAVSLERDVFPSWIGRGLYGHPVHGRFLDIGTPESFAEAEAFFNVSGTLRVPTASGTRSVPYTFRRRFVVLDRDGTINAEREYLSSPDQVELLPRACEGLRAMRDLGLGLVVVTNQSAVGRGYFDLARLEEIHRHLRELLAREGVELDGVYVCPHRPEERCDCRKPLPGLLHQAAAELGFNSAECFVIGDKPCDIDLGKAVGATTILVRTGYGAEYEAAGAVLSDFIADDLLAAAELIGRQLRASALTG